MPMTAGGGFLGVGRQLVDFCGSISVSPLVNMLLHRSGDLTGARPAMNGNYVTTPSKRWDSNFETSFAPLARCPWHAAGSTASGSKLNRSRQAAEDR
jgi:hypothetical protein